MPGTLDYSPADIVRWLMVNKGLGTDPADSDPWPVFAADEPDSPDAVITVYDTVGRLGGRTQTNGEQQEHHGLQVRIRAGDHVTGWKKARAIATSFDQLVYRNTVTVGSKSYLVHSISRAGDVLSLGKETPTSRRKLFTINVLVSVREL